MNLPIRFRPFATFALAATFGLFAAAVLQAQSTYYWNKNASGNWNDTANWTAAPAGYPNAAGAVADLTQVNITGTRTVTLNADATVGSILVGDIDNTHGYTFAYANGAVLTFNSGSSAAAILKATAGALNTSVNLNISLLSDLVVSNENTAAGTNGFMNFGANGAGHVLSAGSTGLKTLTFSSASTKRINVYSSIQDGIGQVGVVAGVNALADTSVQSVIFYAENTFTGGLTVSGRLTAQSGLADKVLGGAGGALTFAGGSLNFTGTSVSANNTVNRHVTLLAAGGTLDPNSTHVLSFTGTIDGAGALTKTGAGTIILTGNNTYEGGTLINSGTLSVGADSNLGAAGSSVTMNGGTLYFSAGVNVPSSQRNLIVNATSTFALSSSAFINWYGSLSGAGLLIKSGGSTFSLNNTNSNHTGGILVTGGSIRFRGGDGAMGAAGNGMTMSNGTSFVASDNLTMGAGRTLTLLSGTVSFSINTDRTLDWQGSVVGAGGLNKIGAGALILTGAASYTGDTTVSDGTLRLGDDQRILSSSALILNGGTLDLDGHSQSLNVLKILAHSTITLGDEGDNTLVFAASGGEVWASGALLTITGNAVSGQSIRVGTDINGLTADQLAQILVNGNAVGIDAGGYLTFIPEPAAIAQLLGVSALVIVGLRRRSLKR